MPLGEFLDLLTHGLNQGERLVGAAFVGDPNVVAAPRWKTAGLAVIGDRWRFPGNSAYNRYISVSAFHPAADGTWRRQKALFTAGVALMVDDLGTKLPWSAIEGVEPTILVETSPGNFQAWFVLDEPCRNRDKFEQLSKEFVQVRCGGVDPGMLSVTRVGRVPESVNGKEKYGGWSVKVTEFHPDRLYSIDALGKAWDLNLTTRMRPMPPVIFNSQIRERVAMFQFVKSCVRPRRPTPNYGGWTEITCPWVHQHTNQSDTGAAIAEPCEENGYHGAFTCHHGGCMKKKWRDVVELFNSDAAETLDLMNENGDELETLG